MQNFQHPNVLQLITLIIKDNKPNVILPFMDNGDLRTYVRNESNVSQIYTASKKKLVAFTCQNPENGEVTAFGQSKIGLSYTPSGYFKIHK